MPLQEGPPMTREGRPPRRARETTSRRNRGDAMSPRRHGVPGDARLIVSMQHCCTSLKSLHGIPARDRPSRSPPPPPYRQTARPSAFRGRALSLRVGGIHVPSRRKTETRLRTAGGSAVTVLRTGARHRPRSRLRTGARHRACSRAVFGWTMRCCDPVRSASAGPRAVTSPSCARRVGPRGEYYDPGGVQ